MKLLQKKLGALSSSLLAKKAPPQGQRRAGLGCECCRPHWQNLLPLSIQRVQCQTGRETIRSAGTGCRRMACGGGGVGDGQQGLKCPQGWLHCLPSSFSCQGHKDIPVSQLCCPHPVPSQCLLCQRAISRSCAHNISRGSALRAVRTGTFIPPFFHQPRALLMGCSTSQASA